MNEVEKEKEQEKGQEKKEIGLRELGRVTKETKGWIVGVFSDGGQAPYNRDIFY